MGTRKPPPWKRDDFWYDVTKSVVSSLIVAAILFFFAIVFGYIKRPDTRYLTFALAVPPALYFFYAKWEIEAYRDGKQTKGRMISNLGRGSLNLLAMILFVFVLFGYYGPADFK